MESAMKRIDRCILLTGRLAAVALVCALATQSWSQSGYPSRPVKIVLGFPPGQATDTVARTLAQKLTETTGQPFVVENRPGAAGIIGTDLVAKSAPDGYTLVMGSSGPLAVNPGLYGAKLPYDPVRDFAPITVAAAVPLFIVAHPGFPPGTVKELIAYAKANPGKINYASGGSGVTNHLAMEMFKSLAGVDMVHVPFKGGPPALTALIAGDVSVMFETGPGALPHVKAGRLKAIAVGSLQRSVAMPDLPTVAESALPGFEAIAWIAISAPTGTPRPIIQKLNSEIVKILQQPDVKERFLALGAEPVGNTPEEFAAYLKAEIAKWGKVIRESGATVD
jgi:tripartite-type tricarboxylate transporter receptor subunit TctC